MKLPGVFGLKTPQDLMKKAEHDFARFRDSPTDVYAAFDFFVTAQNVPEWKYPNDGNKSQLDKIFNDHVELRVCRHLGNAVKHLELRKSKKGSNLNKQVQSTNLSPGAWGVSWGESWGNAWGRGQLLIVLDPDDPDAAVLGSTISAIDVASKAIEILRKLVP